MSLVTEITGWIETNGFDEGENAGMRHNNRMLKKFEGDIEDSYFDEHFFKDMFCEPKYTGSKNPSYILFGASINYCHFDEWLELFENFIKKLDAFGAFVFVREKDGRKVFAIGYELSDKFTKDIIEFGEAFDYEVCVDGEFPLIFTLLKFLKDDINGRKSKGNV